MKKYEIVSIQEKPQWMTLAAEWFHQKWEIPTEAYLESMEECLKKEGAIPQWYVVLDGQAIIGGIGVIENDFHDRKDLTPNLCALYVEEAYRRQGIAGELLRFVCYALWEKKIRSVYLITERTSFYERYGWEFFCMVHGENDPEPMRLYRYEK